MPLMSMLISPPPGSVIDERGPDALRMPDRLHFGARLCGVHTKHIPAIATEESGDPVIGDAVDVHRYILQLLHDHTELLEVLVGRILKVDRDMDIGHTQP